MTIDEIFGVICLPYRSGHRPCVEQAYVMPCDRNADTPYFCGSGGKTVWELALDLTYQAVTV